MHESRGRDFAGYRGAPPAIRWPGDARLALSVVVHVEEGAELPGRPHIVLPSAFDTNDMRFSNGHFVFADNFARYCIDAFDRLYEEGAVAPRMMSVGLHLRIIGRPGRIAGLERFLAHAASRPGVWFARRDAIAHAWRRGTGLPPWTPHTPLSDLTP